MGHPVQVAGVPLSFEGFANYIGAKGKNEFGGDTAPRNQYRHADHVRHERRGHAPKNTFKVGVEYQYWKNKFGNPDTNNPGATAKTPMVRAEYHFLNDCNFKGNRRMKRRSAGLPALPPSAWPPPPTLPNR
jgi:hypothetical protein